MDPKVSGYNQAGLPAAADTRGILYKPALHFSLIVLLGLFAYSGTLHAPFTFDDGPNIVDNSAIRNLEVFKDISKLKDIPLQQEIKTIFKTRPVGYLSFALNYKLHGLAVTGYHIVNIFIHIMNSLLVYLLVVTTFRTPYFSALGYTENGPQSQSHSLIAFFSALFFVCHPIQTQAVTYVVQRFTSLAAFFCLLSLVAYVKSRLAGSQPVRYGLYVLSVLSAVLAMKTKEISFTLPVLIGFYECMFFEGRITRRAAFLLPLCFTMFIIPLALMDPGKGAEGIDKAIKVASAPDISRWTYLLTQFRVIVAYLRLLFPPIVQNLDYDFPLSRSFFRPEVLLSLLFLLSIAALGIYFLFRSRSKVRGPEVTRLVSFGIFWFFVALSVESSVFPIKDVIFEHRLYFPSAGSFLAITASIMIMKDQLPVAMKNAGKMIVPVLFLVALILSGAAYTRNTVWQDEVLLWEDTVQKSPHKARPHNNLGLSYYKKGLADKALQEYRTVLQLNPDYEGVHLNIGAVYYGQGRLEDALREFQAALRLKPGYAKAHYNMGNVYFKQGRMDDAAGEFQAALRLKPDYAEAHNGLGNVLSAQGRFEEALREFQTALHYRPDFSVARNNCGNLYLKTGRLDKALGEFQAVRKLNPKYIGIYNSIGTTLYRQGRLNEAAKEYEDALRLKPDFTEARENLEFIQRSMENKNH